MDRDKRIENNQCIHYLHLSTSISVGLDRRGSLVSPVAKMSPGADSLDRIGIRLSWMFNSWLQRWARWREQPFDSWRARQEKRQCVKCKLLIWVLHTIVHKVTTVTNDYNTLVSWTQNCSTNISYPQIFFFVSNESIDIRHIYRDLNWCSWVENCTPIHSRR